jgi:hypothetical protein
MTALAMLLGCAEPNRPDSSAASSRAATGEAPFWSAFVVSSEPSYVEHQPTLRQLSDGADAVVIGRVIYFGSNNVRAGEEDGYTELVLGIEIVEEIRGSAGGNSLELSAVFSDVGPREARILQEQLPSDTALLLLRKRQDDGSFRPVNGYGIWAATSRSALDAPLSESRPGDGIYAAEVAPYTTVAELADSLR